MENKFVSSKEVEAARLKRQEEWKKAFERIGESIVNSFFSEKDCETLLSNLLINFSNIVTFRTSSYWGGIWSSNIIWKTTGAKNKKGGSISGND